MRNRFCAGVGLVVFLAILPYGCGAQPTGSDYNPRELDSPSNTIWTATPQTIDPPHEKQDKIGGDHSGWLTSLRLEIETAVEPNFVSRLHAAASDVDWSSILTVDAAEAFAVQSAETLLARSEASLARKIVDVLALSSKKPIDFLYSTANRMAPSTRRALWSSNPYVTLEDFESKRANRVQVTFDQQKRGFTEVHDDLNPAFRGDNSYTFDVEASRKSGRSLYLVRFQTPIRVPERGFGIRMAVKSPRDLNPHLIVRYRLPDYNGFPESRHTGHLEEEDNGWLVLDTAAEGVTFKRNILNVFFGENISTLITLDDNVSIQDLDVFIHDVGFDVNEGEAARISVDALQIYIPEGSLSVEADSGPLDIKADGWTARTTKDRAAGLEDTMEQLNAIGYLGAEVQAGPQISVTTYVKQAAFDGYNFWNSGHAPMAYLMDMEGKILHQWQSDYANLSHWRRCFLQENGDILVVADSRALFKLDKDSNVIWGLLGNYHHDLDIDDDGNIFVLTRTAHALPRYSTTPILEDSVSVLDEHGDLIRKVSLLECIENSLFAPSLHGMRMEGDIFHTNTLEILDGSLESRLPAFKKGNILVCMRSTSTIGVVDLDREEFVWMYDGMWLHPHQPTVLDTNRILIFDNRGLEWKWGNVKASRVMEFDPVTLAVHWSYEGTRERYFYTKTCGSAERLPNGNTLITETDNGRVFEVTPGGDVVWEFWNPRRAGENEELIGKIFELVRLPANFPIDWADEVSDR